MQRKIEVVAPLALLLLTAPRLRTCPRCYAEEFRVPPPATRWSAAKFAKALTAENENRHLSDIGEGRKATCERGCQLCCQSKKPRCRNPAERRPELPKSAEQAISLRGKKRTLLAETRAAQCNAAQSLRAAGTTE